MSLPDMRGRSRKGFYPGLPESVSETPLFMFFPDWVQPGDLTDELIEWFMRSLVAPTRADLERQAAGRCTAEQRGARFDFYGGLCWICREAPGTTVDHVKPLARGGSNWPANLRPACRSCNARKGAIWPYRPSLASELHCDPTWPPEDEAKTCSANTDIASTRAA